MNGATAPVTIPFPRIASAPALPSGGAEPIEPVLDDTLDFYKRYIVFSNDHQAVALTLWTLYTHCFALGQPYRYVPYMLVTSAEPMSGKSTILDLAATLVHNPLDAQDVTPALLGRSLAGKTLLLDEIDGVYSGQDVEAESKAGSIRTILNSGFKMNGTYQRLVKAKGGDFEPKMWSTFGPKILAGIGRTLPDTVQTRSVRLRLARQTAEAPAQKARDRQIRKEAGPLKRRMEIVAAEIGELDFIDEMPESLNSRDQDLWEPLIALAERAGGGWVDLAEAAAIELSKSEPVMSTGMRLLSDIRDLFANLDNPAFLPTKELIGSRVNHFEGTNEATGLCSFEEAQWATMTRGFPITPAKLASLLSEYDITSSRETTGAHTYGPKGYARADFERAWKAYLPSDSYDRPDRLAEGMEREGAK
jgi:hypothetical protein